MDRAFTLRAARGKTVYGASDSVSIDTTPHFRQSAGPPVIPSEARACPEPAEGNLALKIRHSRNSTPCRSSEQHSRRFLSTLLKGFESRETGPTSEAKLPACTYS